MREIDLVDHAAALGDDTVNMSQSQAKAFLGGYFPQSFVFGGGNANKTMGEVRDTYSCTRQSASNMLHRFLTPLLYTPQGRSQFSVQPTMCDGDSRLGVDEHGCRKDERGLGSGLEVNVLVRRRR